MIRILTFIILVVAAAAAVTALANVPGRAVIQFGNTEFSTYSALLFGLIAAGAFLLVGVTLFFSGLFRLPKALARRNRERRREKGLLALTRGLEAVAAGDAGDAQRHAKVASKQLQSEAGLTRLLTAQAAQLAGDETTAEENFAAMLEAPETEFLGLRGLYLQAMKSGDHKEAREYAERAFRLRPGTEWAYQSVYSLQLERGAWAEAREALLKAQQHGHEAGESARRREAALLTAMAYEAEAADDTDTARRHALEALRKAPSFAPAATLAARLEADAGRRSKGGKILDEAWSTAPHPALAKTMGQLYEDSTPERRAERLKKMAETNPSADESRLLIAEQENALGDYAAARDRLEPLMTRAPRARSFAAMATAVRGLYGAEAAQVWLDRAAAAPLDPVPGADGDFHFTTDGWRRLIREFGDHGRLAPPPLEEVRTSLSSEEIRLMLAPPPTPEPEPEPEPEATTLEEDVPEPSAEATVVEADIVEEAEPAPAPDTSDTLDASEAAEETDETDTMAGDESPAPDDEPADDTDSPESEDNDDNDEGDKKKAAPDSSGTA